MIYQHLLLLISFGLFKCHVFGSVQPQKTKTNDTSYKIPQNTVDGDWLVPLGSTIVFQCITCSPSANLTIYKNGKRVIGAGKYERILVDDNIRLGTTTTTPLLQIGTQPPRHSLTHSRILADRYGRIVIKHFSKDFQGAYHCVCSYPNLARVIKFPRSLPSPSNLVSPPVVLVGTWLNNSFSYQIPTLRTEGSGGIWVHCPVPEGWHPLPMLKGLKNGRFTGSRGMELELKTPGEYSCEAENAAGSARSLTLTVPRITTSFPSQLMVVHPQMSPSLRSLSSVSRSYFISPSVSEYVWLIATCLSVFLIITVVVSWLYWTVPKSWVRRRHPHHFHKFRRDVVSPAPTPVLTLRTILQPPDA